MSTDRFTDRVVQSVCRVFVCVCLFVCLLARKFSNDMTSDLCTSSQLRRSKFVVMGKKKSPEKKNVSGYAYALQGETKAFVFEFEFLGRFFDRVDLIKPVSNVRPSVRPCVRTYVRTYKYVRTSFRPQKVYSISVF